MAACRPQTPVRVHGVTKKVITQYVQLTCGQRSRSHGCTCHPKCTAWSCTCSNNGGCRNECPQNQHVHCDFSYAVLLSRSVSTRNIVLALAYARGRGVLKHWQHHTRTFLGVSSSQRCCGRKGSHHQQHSSHTASAEQRAQQLF